MTKPTKEGISLERIREIAVHHCFDTSTKYKADYLVKAIQLALKEERAALEGQEVEINKRSAAGVRYEMACEWFICPACTAEVDEDSKHCTGCGAHIKWVKDNE